MSMPGIVRHVEPQLRLTETLRRISTLAHAAIQGVAGVSIGLTGGAAQLETLASSSELARRADELQDRLGEGPCAAAVTGATPMVSVEVMGHDVRWPAYAPAAAALGVGSQLTLRFAIDRAERGMLNLYAPKPHAFGEDAQRLGGMYAALAAAALSWEDRAQALTDTLRARRTIGLAIGVVMQRHALDESRALDYLIRLSQNTNTKLWLIAQRFVDDANHSANQDPTDLDPRRLAAPG